MIKVGRESLIAVFPLLKKLVILLCGGRNGVKTIENDFLLLSIWIQDTLEIIVLQYHDLIFGIDSLEFSAIQ
jgi:hypothetical protein